jgi:endonuclease/exonuclease/phosphatase family metal-dependent hydrolase
MVDFIEAEQAERATPRRRVVVASYNIHGGVGTDGRRDMARIASVVRELCADVIALQEVDCHLDDFSSITRADTLAELTGMRGIWLPTHLREDRHFANALMTSLPLQRARSIDLSYAGHEPRRALDVELGVGDAKLRVIATHLGLRPAERRHQVRALLATCARPDSSDERETSVLLGDINEWFIAGRPLRWLHAHFGHAPALRTFPSYFPLLALDRIWVHPPRAVTRVWRHQTPESRRASDHLPVVAELWI